MQNRVIARPPDLAPSKILHFKFISGSKHAAHRGYQHLRRLKTLVRMNVVMMFPDAPQQLLVLIPPDRAAHDEGRLVGQIVEGGVLRKYGRPHESGAVRRDRRSRVPGGRRGVGSGWEAGRGQRVFHIIILLRVPGTGAEKMREKKSQPHEKKLSQPISLGSLRHKTTRWSRESSAGSDGVGGLAGRTWPDGGTSRCPPSPHMTSQPSNWRRQPSY